MRLLVTPWTVACQGISRQEYWSGSPFPSPDDLPDPRIKPGSPAWQADSLQSEPPGKPGLVCKLKSKEGFGRCEQDPYSGSLHPHWVEERRESHTHCWTLTADPRRESLWVAEHRYLLCVWGPSAHHLPKFCCRSSPALLIPNITLNFFHETKHPCFFLII